MPCTHILTRTESGKEVENLKAMKKAPSESRAVDRLILDAIAIEEQTAQDAGALGFMARAMTQATLPHSKVDGTQFTRRNGNYTLTIMSPDFIGLPYGSMPRLLLAFVSTEAVKTQNREIELGDSMTAFMHELGMTATGGRWGSIARLKDQATRLFGSTISAVYKDKRGTAIINQPLAEEAVFWWDSRAPSQTSLWKSSVRLSERFFREVVDRPIPIDMRALQALKRSPMALDIYVWLTYRASYVRAETVIPWPVLAMQFGSNYAELRNFRASFVAELRKVVTVYGGISVNADATGLILRPMLTHVGRKK